MFVGDLLEAVAAVLLTVAALLAFGPAAAFAVAGVTVFWIAQGFGDTPLRGDTVSEVDTR